MATAPHAGKVKTVLRTRTAPTASAAIAGPAHAWIPWIQPMEQGSPTLTTLLVHLRIYWLSLTSLASSGMPCSQRVPPRQVSDCRRRSAADSADNLVYLFARFVGGSQVLLMS